MRKILTHKKKLKTFFLFLSIVFWSLSAFAQNKEYYNKSPLREVHADQEMFYIMIEAFNHQTLYKLRNFCNKQGKLAGNCFGSRLGIVVVKEFGSKKRVDDFIYAAKEAGVVKDNKMIVVRKEVYAHYGSCDFSFYRKLARLQREGD